MREKMATEKQVQFISDLMAKKGYAQNGLAQEGATYMPHGPAAIGQDIKTWAGNLTSKQASQVIGFLKDPFKMSRYLDEARHELKRAIRDLGEDEIRRRCSAKGLDIDSWNGRPEDGVTPDQRYVMIRIILSAVYSSNDENK